MLNYAADEIKEVVDYYWKGLSIIAIKRRTGRDVQTIKRILAHEGVTLRSQKEQSALSNRGEHVQLYTFKLTAMEVLACCAYGSGLEPKEIAYRMGYKSQQSARDHLRSAARKIRAREEADNGGQL